MKKMILFTVFLISVINMSSQRIKWEVDTVMSEISFDVNHLVFSNVEGDFFGFDGVAYSDSSDFSDLKITLVIYPQSIKTDEIKRDETLTSERFLDVKNNKTIVFSSTKMKIIENGDNILLGNLKMLGNYQTIDLNVNYIGMKTDTRKRDVADFEVSGVIYPEKWGWKNPPFVSKKVNLIAKIRLIKVGVEY